MSFELSTFRLPCGARCGRVVWSGVATKQEEASLSAQAEPGGELYGAPVLVLAQGMDRLDPEVRAALGNRTEAMSTQWVAIVATSPVVRVAGNFILRMSKNRRHRLFSTEEDAVRWLDERVREEAPPETPDPH